MNERAHDIGGQEGFGSVEAKTDEPVFHEPWEGRVFALLNLLIVLGVANGDAARHAIESFERGEYHSLGYYGRWLNACTRLLEKRGLLSAGELKAYLDAQKSDKESPPVAPATFSPRAGSVALTAKRDVDVAARFNMGDRVVPAALRPQGHTRLPGYVVGKTGIVTADYGTWVLPDSNSEYAGENPQHVYCVQFDGRELWGDTAEAGTTIALDLFESYLEAAA